MVKDRAQSRETSVADLVSAATGGDRDAFGVLHRRFRGMVHATVLVRLGPGEAEDAMQEAFVAAWLRLGELREPEAFGRWIQAIARRKATDRLRRRRATVPLPDSLPSTGAPVDLAPEAREVLAAIARLPSHLSEPLAMRLIEGMTGPEIATATGLTHGSVRVTLHRAMKQLRADLEVSDD